MHGRERFAHAVEVTTDFQALIVVHVQNVKRLKRAEISSSNFVAAYWHVIIGFKSCGGVLVSLLIFCCPLIYQIRFLRNKTGVFCFLLPFFTGLTVNPNKNDVGGSKFALTYFGTWSEEKGVD